MMEWDAWGVAEKRQTLSPQVKALLASALGIPERDPVSRDESTVALSPSSLTEGQLAALSGLLGAEHVRTDHGARLRHAGGKSTPDLLRRRSTDVQEAPDAIVYPASHEEVSTLLSLCDERAIAVVPFGGGTSVVGGLDPERGGFTAVIAVDLRRMSGLVSLDEESGTAVLLPGTTGPEAEELLGAKGFSLGHFPQSFRFASIGGFAATRSSGQASSGYGRFDAMVDAVRIATPRGDLELGRAPASAAGPDLRQLFLGSEGALGIITEVTVRVHRLPEETWYQGWSFPSFDAGAQALRTLVQSDAAPTVLRLSDEAESGLNLALAKDIGGKNPAAGVLAITTVEGTPGHVAARSAEVAAVLSAAGGTALGDEPGKAWDHGRFDAPYLRDALIDAGAVVETLETATSWRSLATLRMAVTTALSETLGAQGTPPLVLCHISHTYRTGASLYFTVVCAAAEDPMTQWGKAKKAAGDAIVAAGGTITHHHAVGRDHQPWLVDEVGELGIEILQAVKRTVDPRGILNPGKLIPVSE
ncbi:FAD-binding oxidoreductase [Mycobacteroides chelonae]|jgi:alkyldihydroxyacetonephosphate synthase